MNHFYNTICTIQNERCNLSVRNLLSVLFAFVDGLTQEEMVPSTSDITNLVPKI